jgi:DNA gyrase/topoisomerase IV subunit A
MELDIPEWKEEYMTLTKRQTAAECLRLLQNVVPINPPIEIPQFYNDVNALKSFVMESEGKYILKMPLSDITSLDSHEIKKMLEEYKKQVLKIDETVKDSKEYY